MRLRLKRIPKENQHVNLLFADHRPKLLIAAEWTALQALHVKTNHFDQHAPGRPSRDKRVLTQTFFVVLGPLNEQVFLMVVSNKRNGVSSHTATLPHNKPW
jgi:hypothetical protein